MLNKVLGSLLILSLMSVGVSAYSFAEENIDESSHNIVVEYQYDDDSDSNSTSNSQHYTNSTWSHSGVTNDRSLKSLENVHVNWKLECNMLQDTTNSTGNSSTDYVIPNDDEVIRGWMNIPLFCYDNENDKKINPNTAEYDPPMDATFLEYHYNFFHVEYPYVPELRDYDVIDFSINDEIVRAQVSRMYESTVTLPENTNVIPYDFEGGEKIPVFNVIALDYTETNGISSDVEIEFYIVR